MSSHFPLSTFPDDWPEPRTLLGPLPCSLISLRAPRLTPSQISRNEITAFPSILYPGVTTAPGNLYHTYKTDMTQFLLRISKKDAVDCTERRVSSHEGSVPGLSGRGSCATAAFPSRAGML